MFLRDSLLLDWNRSRSPLAATRCSLHPYPIQPQNMRFWISIDWMQPETCRSPPTPAHTRCLALDRKLIKGFVCVALLQHVQMISMGSVTQNNTKSWTRCVQFECTYMIFQKLTRIKGRKHNLLRTVCTDTRSVYRRCDLGSGRHLGWKLMDIPSVVAQRCCQFRHSSVLCSVENSGRNWFCQVSFQKAWPHHQQ